MTNAYKSMADIRRMAGESRNAATGAQKTASPLKSSLSTAEVHNSLNAQVGKLDLGLIGNLKTRMHQRSKDTKMQRELTTARVEQATALMKEKLRGEVEIVRMAFKQDFSDRISSLAESAAASQILVLRKLQAIETEARNFVSYDLKADMDELQQMLQQDVIDEEVFEQEAAFLLKRYDRLKQTFSTLMEGYQSTVQNTYQTGSR